MTSAVIILNHVGVCIIPFLFCIILETFADEKKYFYQHCLRRLLTSFWKHAVFKEIRNPFNVKNILLHPFTQSKRFPFTTNTCWFIRSLLE